jgi:peptidoglycan-associated lipoprotein
MFIKNFFLITSSLVILASCGSKKSKTINPEEFNSCAPSFEAAVNDTIFFAFDRSELSHTARADLVKQAEWIRLNADRSDQFIVEGHADIRGTRSYNLALGEKRAAQAEQFLISQGVDSSMLKTVSYGSFRPLIDENNEQAYAKNRRAVTVNQNHKHNNRNR